VVQLSFRWLPETSAWINQLDTLPRRLFHGLRPAALVALRRIIAESRATMPIFEYDMWRDLRIHELVVGADHLVGRVGFTKATVMPAEESVDRSTAPFHYPWGVHDGVRRHPVWLWSRSTGRGRAKLIRWAKSKGIIPATVPEKGSKKEIRGALGDAPPYLIVRHRGVPFLYEALENVGDDLMLEVADRLGVVWSGHPF